ncbi:uncharacterized protein MKS88_000016 [Plasmodium brasilianum]|uniref:uncharacterized protein n=1 Tax=Plasmodium brasilianum TaxID=5824 RepID=UPI00350E3A29|nr:hypothetical protein MKS88_000016 [Plasmodium brasilianum]
MMRKGIINGEEKKIKGKENEWKKTSAYSYKFVYPFCNDTGKKHMRNFSPCQSNLSNHIGYSFINNINAQNSKRKYSMLIQNPNNVVYNINLMEKKEQMLYFNITREDIVRPLFLLFIFANGINC